MEEKKCQVFMIVEVTNTCNIRDFLFGALDILDMQIMWSLGL